MKYYILKHRLTGVKIYFPEDYFRTYYDEKKGQIFFAMYGNKELYLRTKDYNLCVKSEVVKI